VERVDKSMGPILRRIGTLTDQLKASRGRWPEAAVAGCSRPVLSTGRARWPGRKPFPALVPQPPHLLIAA
jgi:hypothetical protein